MSFDSHSIERLKELGRKLPKEISKSEPLKTKDLNQSKRNKLHPVEIETNPNQLFRKLMEISPDGNVPSHLIERLRKLESSNIKSSSTSETVKSEKSQESTSNESLNLYTEFKQLLLEDDID